MIRAFVFLVPIVGSVVFVHLASRAIEMPTSSFVLFVTWWVVLSAGATAVLVGLDRASRRLLPLVALLNLSLAFPDQAPSRFRTAMRSNTVETLEQRVGSAKALNDNSTPVEAAEHLLALVADLDVHDRVTCGHSERVRAYAQMIGNELGLKPDELDALNWAALLHDIGKLKVPAEILNKVGQPTPAEWDVLRRHTQFGDELIDPLREWLGEWSQAVGQHHERWDGGGYPLRISGAGISLAARIVSVADVFDVITSARSYKQSFAPATARDEIARCAGTYFDPRVVRAFLNISLGRLRLVMGPLSWLAYAPILGRLPLTPAIGTVSMSLATVAAALTTGMVATPPTPGVAGIVVTPAQGHDAVDPILQVIREDERAMVGVERAEGGASVTSLRVVAQPSVGSVRVTQSRRLVYSPPPDFSGDVSIRYEACWSGLGCRRGVVTISVLPVNDPPVARDDRAMTGSGSPVSIDVLANDSDPDGDPLSILAVSELDAGRAQIVGRRVRWSPPPEFVGAASFRYTAADPQGGRASALVAIRVTGTSAAPPPASSGQAQPNDAAAPAAAAAPSPPTAAASPPQAQADRLSVPEGASVLVDALANDFDPDGDALSIVSVGAPARGRAQKVGDRVQFTAPSDFVGTVTFPYTITDVQGATDSTTVSVTVLLVNTPPSFAAGADQSVSEDAASQSVPGWAWNIVPGPASEASQSVSFRVAADNPGLFAVQPHVDAAGTLTYRPAPNAFGSATVTVRARDTGGTANGGNDTSAPRTFTITVTPVNDPPTFAASADQSVSEDAASQSVPGWAWNIVPGPANEAGQSVSFPVAADNPGLFAVQPHVDASGTLTYRPAPNAFGSATVTVRAKDAGGTANGGNDTSAPRTFTITVTSVNDSPTVSGDVVGLDEDDPSGVTFDVLANDTDADAGDTLSVSAFDDSTITHGTLTDNGAGSFTYVPGSDFAGSETFSYTASDGNGGTNSAFVTLTVTSRPDAPDASADAYTTSQDMALAPGAPGVLDNDADADGDTLTIQTTPIVPPANGTLILSSAGSFTYAPASGFSGTDSFTYRVEDGTGRTDDAVVTITVSSTITFSSLYFADTGPLSTIWGMTTSPPAPASPVPDYEGDGSPGLSIRKSDGSESITDPAQLKAWAYTTSAPLVLGGPVTLQLWSTLADFRIHKSGHPYVYLYDCAAGGTGCVKIAENDVHANDWNGGVNDWLYRTITVGSVDHTIATGRALKVVLLFKHEDLWLAMTAAYPSGLTLTLG